MALTIREPPDLPQAPRAGSSTATGEDSAAHSRPRKGEGSQDPRPQAYPLAFPS